MTLIPGTSTTTAILGTAYLTFYHLDRRRRRRAFSENDLDSKADANNSLDKAGARFCCEMTDLFHDTLKNELLEQERHRVEEKLRHCRSKPDDFVLKSTPASCSINCKQNGSDIYHRTSLKAKSHKSNREGQAQSSFTPVLDFDSKVNLEEEEASLRKRLISKLLKKNRCLELDDLKRSEVTNLDYLQQRAPINSLTPNSLSNCEDSVVNEVMGSVLVDSRRESIPDYNTVPQHTQSSNVKKTSNSNQENEMSSLKRVKSYKDVLEERLKAVENACERVKEQAESKREQIPVIKKEKTHKVEYASRAKTKTRKSSHSDSGSSADVDPMTIRRRRKKHDVGGTRGRLVEYVDDSDRREYARRDHDRKSIELKNQKDDRYMHEQARIQKRNDRIRAGQQVWGKEKESSDALPSKKIKTEKQKPDLGLSGALAKETNMFRGVVIKYSEPPDAKIPKARWRMYPFKGEEQLKVLYIHRQSAYLIGKDRLVCDMPMDHPSISKQHAALQYRRVPFTRENGIQGKRVRPYIIDLNSTNGTFLNNKRIDSQRYVELKEKDMLKFGFSTREYVMLHEHSQEDGDDDE